MFKYMHKIYLLFDLDLPKICQLIIILLTHILLLNLRLFTMQNHYL